MTWWEACLVGLFAAVVIRGGIAWWLDGRSNASVPQTPPARVDMLDQRPMSVSLTKISTQFVVFYHRGIRVVTEVHDHITSITVPLIVGRRIVEYHYRKTNECLPIGDRLATVFAAEGESDD